MMMNNELTLQQIDGYHQMMQAKIKFLECQRKQHRTKHDSLASRMQNNEVNKKKKDDRDAEEKSTKFMAYSVP